MKSYDYSEMSGLKADKKIFVRAYDAKSKSTHNYKVIGRLKIEIDFYLMNIKEFLNLFWICWLIFAL